MRYYIINITSIPHIAFAHGYSSDEYRIVYDHPAPIIEIAYLERGDLIYACEGRVTKYDTLSLITISHDKTSKSTCSDGRQGHFTVGFRIDEGWQCTDADGALKYGGEYESYAILPEYIPQNEGSADYQKLIKQIIEQHSEPGNLPRIRRTSLLYELFANLTEYSLIKASDESGMSVISENLYYRRALKYIAGHLDSKIYMADVANAAGISYGYLNNIFRAAAGCTMVDYINKIKLRRVCELITTKNITLEEAGRSIGITDVKYLSRLFKRYNGITAGMYRNLHNNIEWSQIGVTNDELTNSKSVHKELSVSLIPQTKG